MLSLFKSKIEIVEFENGKFAVRKKRFLLPYIYYGKCEFYIWKKPEHVMLFCAVDTLYEAKEILYGLTLKIKKVHNG
jgi:hypothetical protein